MQSPYYSVLFTCLYANSWACRYEKMAGFTEVFAKKNYLRVVEKSPTYASPLSVAARCAYDNVTASSAVLLVPSLNIV